jgi:hypothetical protein
LLCELDVVFGVVVAEVVRGAAVVVARPRLNLRLPAAGIITVTVGTGKYLEQKDSAGA